MDHTVFLKAVALCAILDIVCFRCTRASSTELAAFNTTCTTDSDCGNIMTSCQNITVTSPNGTGSHIESRCACDNTKQFYRHGDTCRYHARLGQPCTSTNTSVCVDSGAICGHAGDLYTTNMRCQCSLDKIMVDHNGTNVCARPLTMYMDGQCETCEQQSGRCYDVDADGKRDGCQCPVSLTGEDCEIVHVFVQCTVSDFKMTVCYDPHDGVNLTSGARMHTEHHGTDVACQGVQDVDGLCHHGGSWRLELPLSESERDRCGTSRTFSQSGRKYENRIFVDMSAETGDPNDYIMFKTYCMFQTHATASFTGMGVFAVADGWAGEESKPYIEMSIERALGDLLSENTPIRLGDGVRFRIKLNTEGDYGALRVESCTLSSTYTMGNPMAQTLEILSNSCPTADRYLDSSNTWHLEDGNQPNDVTTGLVYPPMMAAGDRGATFLHCRVKLCLKGEIDKCKPVRCNQGRITEHESYGRRRRDLPDVSDRSSSMELSKGIYFRNNEGQSVETAEKLGHQQLEDEEFSENVIVMDKTHFAIGVALLLLLLIISMVAVIILSLREMRLHKATSKVATRLPASTRPPLFHLPRNA